MINTIVSLEDLLSKRRNLKVFLFDLDGTLIDSQDGIIATISNFLASKGHYFDEQTIKQRFGKPLEVVFGELIPDLSEEETLQYLKEIRVLYAENHLKITSVYPQVLSLLEELRSHGFKIGIASTKFRKFIIEALEHFNLIKYFDVIVSGYEVENHKPAPDIILKSMELLNIPAENCVYIGDAPSDVLAGKASGALTIAVLTGANGLDKMLPLKPDFIIADLGAIKIKVEE